MYIGIAGAVTRRRHRTSRVCQKFIFSNAADVGGENRERDEMAGMSILNGSFSHHSEAQAGPKRVSLETRLFHRLDREMEHTDGRYSDVIDLMRVNRRVFEPAFLSRKMICKEADTSRQHNMFDILLGLRAQLRAIRDFVSPIRLPETSEQAAKG